MQVSSSYVFVIIIRFSMICSVICDCMNNSFTTLQNFMSTKVINKSLLLCHFFFGDKLPKYKYCSYSRLLLLSFGFPKSTIRLSYAIVLEFLCIAIVQGHSMKLRQFLITFLISFLVSCSVVLPMITYFQVYTKGKGGRKLGNVKSLALTRECG